MTMNARLGAIVMSVLAAIACVTYDAAAVSPTFPHDMEEARALCEEMPVSGIEGIWEYPEDRVKVLVLREGNGGKYSISVVESDDCSLRPGEKIGYMEGGTDPDKYKMTLYTTRKSGRLADPRECLATYNENNEAIRVEKASVRISLNPSWMLPKFWRMVKVRVKDPLAGYPEGMIRIYPSYDGNGSSRRQPRYL